jgi:hypothetical protein
LIARFSRKEKRAGQMVFSDDRCHCNAGPVFLCGLCGSSFVSFVVSLCLLSGKAQPQVHKGITKDTKETTDSPCCDN